MRGLAPAVAALALVFAGTAMAGSALIRGTATYRERLALRPGAVLEVELLDVSRADAPAERLGAVSFPVTHQVPIGFELPYDPAAIEPRHRYSVAARLVAGGRVIFRSDSANPVLTNGAGDSVDILMVRMAAPPAAGAADPAALLATWTVDAIGGEPAAAGVASYLTLSADGRAEGSGGCNRFSGGWTADGAALRIGPLAATRRACLPAPMQQEDRFFAALEAARGFRIEAGRLVLVDAAGAPLARLRRQP